MGSRLLSKSSIADLEEVIDAFRVFKYVSLIHHQTRAYFKTLRNRHHWELGAGDGNWLRLCLCAMIKAAAAAQKAGMTVTRKRD